MRVAVRGDDVDAVEAACLAAAEDHDLPGGVDVETVDASAGRTPAAADLLVVAGEAGRSSLAASGATLRLPTLPVGGPGPLSVARSRLAGAVAAHARGETWTVSHPVLAATVDGERAGTAVADVSLMTDEPARISEYAVATGTGRTDARNGVATGQVNDAGRAPDPDPGPGAGPGAGSESGAGAGAEPGAANASDGGTTERVDADDGPGLAEGPSAGRPTGSRLHLDRFRADGVVVATPLGSAGYASDAGGPIVAPGTGLAVVPVAPFATDSASYVVGPDVTLSVERDDTDVVLLVDDREAGPVRPDEPVRVVPTATFPLVRVP